MRALLRFRIPPVHLLQEAFKGHLGIAAKSINLSLAAELKESPKTYQGVAFCKSVNSGSWLLKIED